MRLLCLRCKKTYDGCTNCMQCGGELVALAKCKCGEPLEPSYKHCPKCGEEYLESRRLPPLKEEVQAAKLREQLATRPREESKRVVVIGGQAPKATSCAGCKECTCVAKAIRKQPDEAPTLVEGLHRKDESGAGEPMSETVKRA